MQLTVPKKYYEQSQLSLNTMLTNTNMLVSASENGGNSQIPLLEENPEFPLGDYPKEIKGQEYIKRGRGHYYVQAGEKMKQQLPLTN